MYSWTPNPILYGPGVDHAFQTWSLVDLSGVICRHVDFVHVHDRRILAVIVAENGIVTNKVITLEVALEAASNPSDFQRALQFE